MLYSDYQVHVMGHVRLKHIDVKWLNIVINL